MDVLGQQLPPVQLAPDQVLGFVLLNVAIIIIVARIMGGLFKRIGQPTVVGEIVGGVLLGPTLLGRSVFAWDEPWSFLNCDKALAVSGADPSITACLFPPQSRSVLSILGQLALVFFMFLVGLELDWDLLKGKGRKIATVAFGAVAVPIGLAFVIGPILFTDDFVAGFGTPDEPSQLSFTFFIAAMLTVTAFPVMARILQEKGMTASAMGAVGVAAAAIVTVAMFLTVAVAAGVASEQGPSSLAVKFLIAGVYIAVLFLVVRPLLIPLGRAYEEAGKLTPGLFAAVLIVLLLSSYAAHQIGINVIVGGFLAGAVMPARTGAVPGDGQPAGRPHGHHPAAGVPRLLRAQHRLHPAAGGHLAGIALFLVAGVVGKWLGSAAFARVAGMSWAEGNVLGILMNCRGLLVLVVALIGFNQGVLSAPMQVGGVVMALVTTMMTGPLFDRFAPSVAPVDAAPPDPAVPGSGRVLVSVGDLDTAPVLAQLGFAVTGDHRPADVVLSRLLGVSDYDEIGPGVGAEILEIEESLRAMRVLGGFAPDGVTVASVARAAPHPATETARVAVDRGAEVVLVPDEASADVAARLRRDGAQAATVLGGRRPGAGSAPDRSERGGGRRRRRRLRSRRCRPGSPARCAPSRRRLISCTPACAVPAGRPGSPARCALRRQLIATGRGDLVEEVVPLVVDHDEGGEVLDLDPPDRLHAQLRVLEHLDLADAVLGQAGGGPADRAQVEPAVGAAGVGDLPAAVPLGQHDERPAGGLELLDVGVHASGRGGPEAARRHAGGRLGRPGVVHAVVPQVLRHRLAGVEALLDLGVGDVAGHHHRSGQRQPGLDRVAGQLGADLVHRPVQVDAHDVAAEVLVGGLREVVGGVLLELLEEEPSAVILPRAWRSAEHDTATATGHEAPWRGSRTTRTSWQKYFPPNWAPMPKPWVRASTSASSSRSRNPWPSSEPTGGQAVEVAGRRVLGRLQRVLRRGAADHDARWYGGHAAVPSVRSFSSSHRSSDDRFSSALVSWNR
jgi:Kef-type K+ transport system membrane component KefB